MFKLPMTKSPGKLFAAILVAFTCQFHLTAQQLDGQLQQLLPTLSAEESTKVLEYARHLGAYHGKALEPTCKMLDAANQQRVLRYIGFLKNPGAPEPTTVRFLRDTIPFGRIEEGMILLDSFVVVNTGDAPYVIHSSKGSCDCTTLSYPKFPVMPGDTATIRVEFDSINKAGYAVPGVIVYDNSRPNRRHLLYMEGEIKPKGNVKTIIRN